MSDQTNSENITELKKTEEEKTENNMNLLISIKQTQ